MPANRTLGVTAETNRPTPGVSVAPAPMARLVAFGALPGHKLVTVEPIMRFDLAGFRRRHHRRRPDLVIVGADSKGCGLAEPSRAEILALLESLRPQGWT